MGAGMRKQRTEFVVHTTGGMAIWEGPAYDMREAINNMEIIERHKAGEFMRHMFVNVILSGSNLPAGRDMFAHQCDTYKTWIEPKRTTLGSPP
jgi:hypothetical protein